MIGQCRHFSKYFCYHLFHYYFWKESYDEWINLYSNRIKDHCSKIWIPGKKFRINQRIDVFDNHPQQKKFLSAKILEVSDNGFIKVHYANHGNQWDEYIDTNCDSKGFCRIAPWGHKSKKDKFIDDYEKLTGKVYNYYDIIEIM